MILSLLLPWFPIILAVGVGGRLLGRTRGLGLGILCSLFWVVLVQASEGTEVWHDPWTVVTVIAGATAIATMGRWSGDQPLELESIEQASRGAPGVAPSVFETSADQHSLNSVASLRQVCKAVDHFDDWLARHRDDSDPWPKFDEFLRTTLYESCQATHVKPYRLDSDGEVLTPLGEADPLHEEERLSARRGIVGHVVTTGRAFVSGDVNQGELVSQLADQSQERPAWCFAVRQGSRRLGAVVVGRMGVDPHEMKPLLETMERMVSQFWSTLTETALSRSAVQIDPVSGVYSRVSFLRASEEALAASYRQGEPVAVVVFALEGLRDINDSGRWEVSEELLREVSDSLRRKVRIEDQLGRFDGSRFILLLRRVDSELASLIANQMITRITEVCSNESRWSAKIAVRCGLTGSGTEEPTLRLLVTRALQQCKRARLEKRPLASDLEPAFAVGETA